VGVADTEAGGLEPEGRGNGSAEVGRGGCGHVNAGAGGVVGERGGGAVGGDRTGERGGVAAVVPRGGAPAFHLERGAGRERAAAAGAADSGLDGVDAEASGEVGTDGADVGDDDGGV